MKKNAIKTTHNLDFEACHWEAMSLIDTGFMRFRIGTCEGLWRSTATTYDILAIDNKCKGNGHFEDVLQWFEFSCRRDKKNLMILEVWNSKLKVHLISKRGFKPLKNSDHVVRYFHHGLKSLIPDMIPEGVIEFSRKA